MKECVSGGGQEEEAKRERACGGGRFVCVVFAVVILGDCNRSYKQKSTHMHLF